MTTVRPVGRMDRTTSRATRIAIRGMIDILHAADITTTVMAVDTEISTTPWSSMTITAKIIADSISVNGDRLTTFELEYPRFIHAEFMTHRLFSRNAASSRAIPVKKAIELIVADTARPIHWGKNQPGMSAKEECKEDLRNVLEIGNDSPWPVLTPSSGWDQARDNAIYIAEKFNEAGYHKQIVNRILEPFTHIKVVCTATEYDNFFYLRCHPDAQPEIQELANQMYAAYTESTPVQLKNGEWHVPYYEDGVWQPTGYVRIGEFDVQDLDKHNRTLSEALAISSSCCAQVSYRRLDDSLEKAQDIFNRLVDSKPVHASPFEHQGTPMWLNKAGTNPLFSEGATHLDSNGHFWSGNLKGWIQHRQLIAENVCNEYRPV